MIKVAAANALAMAEKAMRMQTVARPGRADNET